MEPVTALLLTCAVAEIVVAPAALTLAGESVTEATPPALVSAVPLEGAIVAMVGSVANVTTAFGTAAPFASSSVAFTVAGEPVEIDAIWAPVLLYRATLIAGAAATPVAGGVPPFAPELVPVLVPVLLPLGKLPAPHPTNNVVNAANIKAVKVLVRLM